ncbi:hypothetical protein BH10BAC1_BH10BAC1_19710 [soil metagenome]
MKLFLKILYSKWADVKIWIRINFFYPYKKNYSEVKSILPPSLELKEGTIIGKQVIISGHLKEIGKNLYIGGNTYIGLCFKIGSFTSISIGVKIGLKDHPLDAVSTSPVFYGKKRGWVTENKIQDRADMMVEIGNDVLISANVIILQGVKVGDGSVIAAGAVVNKDVEPYSIVGGVPAKIIRYRFDENTRKELLESKWWELTDEKLKTLINESNDPKLFLNSLNR